MGLGQRLSEAVLIYRTREAGGLEDMTIQYVAFDLLIMIISLLLDGILSF